MAAIATTTTPTTQQQHKWQDLIWMDEGIEVGLRFISKLAEVVLLIGVGYAGYKIAHKGGTPPVLDEIWLVSQVLALDLSAPGMFASAKAATRAGELERAKWAKAIGISLIIMSILSMIDGATQYYLVGLVPTDIITWSSLIMTIIRCAAAVGYSVYCRYSKVDIEPVVSPAQAPQQQAIAVVPTPDHERLERLERAFQALADQITTAMQQQQQPTQITELINPVVPAAIPQSSETLPQDEPTDEPITDPAIGTVSEPPRKENGTETTPERSTQSSETVPTINIATRRKSLTTLEVANVLGCSERHVRDLRNQGKLERDDTDEKLIKAASVRAFLKARVAQ